MWQNYYEEPWQGIKPGRAGNCGHCGMMVRFEAPELSAGEGSFTIFEPVDQAEHRTHHRLEISRCPGCGKSTIQIGEDAGGPHDESYYPEIHTLWPSEQTLGSSVSENVPKNVAKDFNEARAILHLSPTASAALSRRCLQSILRLQGYTQYNLADQVKAVVTNLPTYLQKIDHVREIGNLAAHESKDQQGEIVDVSGADAAWLLDILALCFDFFFDKPATAKNMEERLERSRRPPRQQGNARPARRE